MEGLKSASASQPDLYGSNRQSQLLDTRSTEGFNSIEVAHAMCMELMLVGQSHRIMLDEVLQAYRPKNPARTWEQCGEDLLAIWYEYDKTVTGKYKKGFKSFFADGWYMKRTEWANKSSVAPSATPSARNLVDERRKRIGLGSKPNG